MAMPAIKAATIEAPAIEAIGLGKNFGQVIAVDHLDFRVARGSSAALLGGNGAGKTTTIAMLLGLLLPSTGTARLFGVDMRHQRYRVLPLINFSSPYFDMPRRLTVRQNLAVYGRLYGVENLKDRINALAEELDLTALLDQPIGQLSAGQKTRSQLAKSAINEPAILFLDEPTASLDPDTADWVRGWLEWYRKRTGATLFLASHNMAEVERLCDDVLMLKAGRLVDRGTPAALIARYGRLTLEEVFLDIARGRLGELDSRQPTKAADQFADRRRRPS
jgi:ABC-2 type transport system ATP-binding protein